ncbi:MAG: TraR/DksA family transcriptional regulator [Chloroflexia bacterium]|nr:TraR/DksA family transcriptional regulator [Chloroflexia bacterium]
MNRINKEEIKSQLLKEIEQTERLVVDYKEHIKPVEHESTSGQESGMDAINDKSAVNAALRQAEVKLNGLKSTLSQIENNDFGLCAKCGQPIPIGRILLMPYSRFCIGCSQC